jgi:hypothetical protein
LSKYQRSSASGSFARKKNPPMPLTLCMGSMISSRVRPHKIDTYIRQD